MNMPDANDVRLISGAEVDHFGIVVRNLEVAMAFYRDMLGCHVTEPVERPGQGLMKAYVDFANMRIELIAPNTANSPIKHVLERHNASDFLARQPGGGLHHVCYTVPNLAATCAALVKAGYRILGNVGPVIGGTGNAVCFLDPDKLDGVLVELKEVKRTQSATTQFI